MNHDKIKNKDKELVEQIIRIMRAESSLVKNGRGKFPVSQIKRKVD